MQTSGCTVQGDLQSHAQQFPNVTQRAARELTLAGCIAISKEAGRTTLSAARQQGDSCGAYAAAKAAAGPIVGSRWLWVPT